MALTINEIAVTDTVSEPAASRNTVTTSVDKNSEVPPTSTQQQYGRKSQFNQSQIAAANLKLNNTTESPVPPRKSLAATLGLAGNDNRNKASFVRGEQTVCENGLVQIHKLPESLKDLANRFDRDGTGVLEITEIVDALLYCHQEEVTIARLTKELWFAMITIVILLISVFGLSYASTELAKDFRPEDGTATLVSADGTPIKVGSSDLMVDGNGNLVPQSDTAAARNLSPSTPINTGASICQVNGQPALCGASRTNNAATEEGRQLESSTDNDDDTGVVITSQPVQREISLETLSPSDSPDSFSLTLSNKNGDTILAKYKTTVHGVATSSDGDRILHTSIGFLTIHVNGTFSGSQEILTSLQNMKIDKCDVNHMNNPDCNTDSTRRNLDVTNRKLWGGGGYRSLPFMSYFSGMFNRYDSVVYGNNFPQMNVCRGTELLINIIIHRGYTTITCMQYYCFHLYGSFKQNTNQQYWNKVSVPFPHASKANNVYIIQSSYNECLR